MTPFKSTQDSNRAIDEAETDSKQTKKKALPITVMLAWLLPILIIWILQIYTGHPISTKTLALSAIVITLFLIGNINSNYINN